IRIDPLRRLLHKAWLVCQPDLIAQSRQQAGPRYRPVGRDIVDDTGIGQNLDVGAELIVADLGPRRSDCRNQSEQKRQDAADYDVECSESQVSRPASKGPNPMLSLPDWKCRKAPLPRYRPLNRSMRKAIRVCWPARSIAQSASASPIAGE